MPCRATQLRVAVVAAVPDVPDSLGKSLRAATGACERDDGRFYAIEDRCPHEDYALSEGELDGYMVECPRHGSRFDIRTGDVLNPSAVLPVATFAVDLLLLPEEIDPSTGDFLGNYPLALSQAGLVHAVLEVQRVVDD